MPHIHPAKNEKNPPPESNTSIDSSQWISKSNSRRIQIVHLENHKLFLEGVRITLQRVMPNLKIFEFGENDSALNFIIAKICDGTRIDFIITDYNHPGPNGLIFAQEVKKIENYFHIRLPLMVLTMCWGDEYLCKAAKEGIIDYYLPKNSTPDLIINSVKEGCFTK